jgi:hypothetical protein
MRSETGRIITILRPMAVMHPMPIAKDFKVQLAAIVSQARLLST